MERIRTIQQNLWQTRQYITHEKEQVTKLHEELKAPITKLNKSAWIINQKWRMLRLKRNKATELSEVDRYSQSLDKCRFLDAKDRLGPETEQFANFLKALRDNPSLIAIIFLTDSHTRGNAQQLSELIHITLSTAYGFGVLPSDEKRLIQVVCEVARIQLAEFVGPIQNLFSTSSTPLSLCLRLFIEWSHNTRCYISDLMQDVIYNIISEPELFVVEERRYAEKYPHYKDLMTIRSKVEGYRKRIAEHVVAMVTQIRRHLHSFPPYLRWLGCCMSEFLRQYQGCNQDQINFVLGEFFYTRMLFFPFIQPTNFAQTKSEVSDLAKSNLKMVTLAFREVFLMQLGFLTYEKCSFTSVFQYIGDYKCHIITLLEEIVDVPYSSAVLQTDDVPLHRSALMIPERHLKKLISTLMEFLASGRFQPDEKEMLATALAQLPSEPTRYLRDRPARPERPPAPGSEKAQKKNKPELPNPTPEEEILVFSLPSTHGDKLKSQTEVLGKNLDSTNDGSIIDRCLEPSLGGDPLSVQEDMKGRLFHDFDLLFHNPTLQMATTPDGISLSSAASYDSLDKNQQDDAAASEDGLSLPLVAEEGGETISGDCGTLRPGEDEDLKTPIMEQSTQFTMEDVIESAGDGGDMGSEYSAHSGNAASCRSSVISESVRHSGAFLEESATFPSGTPGLSRINSTMLFGEISTHEHTVPINLIDNQGDRGPSHVQVSEEKLVEHAIDKLKIALSLFPHFYRSYYPKFANNTPCTIDLISLSPSGGTTALVLHDDVTSEHRQLLEYLHSEFAEARVNNNKNTVQLEQAIIALQKLPPNRLTTVLTSLEEYNSDLTLYIQYLTERKCDLLRSKEFLARAQNRLELKHQFFYESLASLVTANFLRSFDDQFREYRRKFREAPMADEKAEVFCEYCDYVTERMAEDMSIQTLGINHSSCDERECLSNECLSMEAHQKEVLRLAEVNFFSLLFNNAFLPNGDAQLQKDVMFRQRLNELQVTASLDHPDIQIPARYHREAPWTPAQYHLNLLPAFKSPSGKLSCVISCVFTIFKLLFVGASGLTVLDGTTDESSVPGADDLMPVLIYIIIHCNPPNLLSTIEYINYFLPRNISGQDQYMWMQFSGAVEFIKTMLQRST